MEEKTPSPVARLAFAIENAIMTRLVPTDGTGLVFKWLFKIPIFFYKIGLPLFGDFILLLTSTGRKSGKARRTPLEYRREDGSGFFIIMAGWGGKTDWAANITSNPRVHVQAGWKHFDALAEKLNDEEVAAWLYYVVQVNPASLKMWSRWAGPLDGSLESMNKAAKYFPSFRLKPIEEK
jgi:deazaflavin-dependent oxidoreductase (nitroreductase family)